MIQFKKTIYNSDFVLLRVIWLKGRIVQIFKQSNLILRPLHV